MDVMDAGVYVGKWEADVPKHTKTTLWGPLQAKEMGLDGWDIQDGGETGFVMHNPGVKLTMGRATSTLIFVRRLERAFLTVYFGGYPTDAPAAQRKLDMQKVVNACEMFLARLAKEKVKFEFQGELALVDNQNDATPRRARAKMEEPKSLGGGKLSRGDIIDADEELARKAGYPTSPRKAKPTVTDEEADTITLTKTKKPKKDEEDLEHVDGAPSWVRVPGAKGKIVDADVVPKKTSGKNKNEVWEV